MLKLGHTSNFIGTTDPNNPSNQNNNLNQNQNIPGYSARDSNNLSNTSGVLNLSLSSGEKRNTERYKVMVQLLKAKVDSLGRENERIKSRMSDAGINLGGSGNEFFPNFGNDGGNTNLSNNNNRLSLQSDRNSALFSVA